MESTPSQLLQHNQQALDLQHQIQCLAQVVGMGGTQLQQNLQALCQQLGDQSQTLQELQHGRQHWEQATLSQSERMEGLARWVQQVERVLGTLLQERGPIIEYLKQVGTHVSQMFSTFKEVGSTVQAQSGLFQELHRGCTVLSERVLHASLALQNQGEGINALQDVDLRTTEKINSLYRDMSAWRDEMINLRKAVKQEEGKWQEMEQKLLREIRDMAHCTKDAVEGTLSPELRALPARVTHLERGKQEAEQTVSDALHMAQGVQHLADQVKDLQAAKEVQSTNMKIMYGEFQQVKQMLSMAQQLPQPSTPGQGLIDLAHSSFQPPPQSREEPEATNPYSQQLPTPSWRDRTQQETQRGKEVPVKSTGFLPPREKGFVPPRG